MSFSDLKISKEGRLLANESIYDEDKEKWVIVENRDVTSRPELFLLEECSVEDGATCRSLLKLIDNINNYEFFSPLLTNGPWLKDFVDEGLNSPKESGEKEFSAINLKWIAEVRDDYVNKSKASMDEYIDVYGTIGEESYAIDLTPMNKMIDAKIVLNKKMDIADERDEKREAHLNWYRSLPEKAKERENPYIILVSVEKEFTLLDIIRGFFWEVSFHGGPEGRDKRAEELSQIIIRIDSGEEKLVSLDDIKNRIDGLFDSENN